MPVGLTTVATFDFSNPNAGACATSGGGGGPIRCLRVRLSRGGQTRMCDPAVDATDTRSCGT
jgi:type IV fimbrial biogenesis protein FimT